MYSLENGGPESAMRVENLTKSFGELTAVDHLDLDVPKGEILGLLGPNGAGKSTAIRMMTGMLSPTEGKVFIGNEEIRSATPEVKKRIGVCPQEPLFWERLSCLENLSFLASMYEMGGRKEARKRSETLLESVGLSDKAGTRASKLSGGMKKRLNLAMALVHDPEIVILDEPITGLDPQSRLLITEFIRHLCRSEGKTVLLTTHLMEVAADLSERIAIMDHGKLLVIDTVEALERTLGNGDVVEMTFAGVNHLQSARAMITSMAGVDQIAEQESTLRFRALGAIKMLPSLFQRLHEEGAEITDLRVHGNTLEDVFISLTGRALRN